MQPIQNFLLIKPDLGYDHLNIADVSFKIDTSFNPGHHFTSSGIVVAVPSRLYFDRKASHETSLRYNTELEVAPGDKVILHYQAFDYARTHNMFYNDAAFVKYDALFVRLRDNEIFPLNGVVLAEPLQQVKNFHNLQLPGTLQKKQRMKSRVRFIGNPLKGYFDYNESDTHHSLKPDDVIIHKQFDAIPIQYKNHEILYKGRTLYRMHIRDVDGLIRGNPDHVTADSDINMSSNHLAHA